jgi:(2Fe-2S) ferredoxin
MIQASSSTSQRWLVQVCQHRTCQRHQAREVLATFQTHQCSHIRVAESGCMGQCSAGPNVHIMPNDTWYCRVTPQDADIIVEQHLKSGERVKERLHPRFHPGGVDGQRP